MLGKNGKLINPEIRIETCNSCNGKCTFCAYNSMTRPKGTMPFNLFKKIVDEGIGMGVKMVSPFGFGEPLLDNGLTEKIEYCSSKGLDTFFTTNGSLCSYEKMHDLFLAGLTKIRFSIHGFGKHYKDVQRELEFDKVMTNFFSTLHLRDNLFPNTTIALTMIPQDVEALSGVLPYVWEVGNCSIDELEVWKPHNWGDKKECREVKNKEKKSCNRMFSGPVQVQWDGKVIPCCFLTDAEVVLGDVRKQSLKKVLTGKPYKEFQEKHRKGNLEGLPCKNCDQRNIGDSPLLFSSIDKRRGLDKTSSLKFKLKGEENGINI